MQYGKKASQQVVCDNLLGNLRSFHSFRCTQTTYLNTVAVQVHPFTEMVFPDGSGFFQQDNVPCHTATTVQEWFEEHKTKSEGLNWPSHSPDLKSQSNRVKITEAPPHSLEHLKGLLLMASYQIQHMFQAFGRKKGVIMLWLIDKLYILG